VDEYLLFGEGQQEHMQAVIGAQVLEQHVEAGATPRQRGVLRLGEQDAIVGLAGQLQVDTGRRKRHLVQQLGDVPFHGNGNINAKQHHAL